MLDGNGQPVPPLHGSLMIMMIMIELPDHLIIHLNIFKSMIRGFIFVGIFCFHLQGVSISPESQYQISVRRQKEVGCIVIFLIYVQVVIWVFSVVL